MRARLAVAAVLFAAGCLPSPPPPPRLFTPEIAPPTGAPAAPAEVRVAPVRSPVYLREQMTWRRSDVEIGLSDQRRWSELPATYVERALVRALGGSERDVGAPVVATELLAFEEVLQPVHEARVEIAVEVVDGRCTWLRRSFAAARPLGADDPAAVARATGEALDEVADAAAAAIRSALAGRRRCEA